jgi:phospholipid/cholesterol/gamma-HCH transport system substrate-binding protein
MPTTRGGRIAAVAVAVALLAGLVVVLWPGAGQKTATIYFPRAIHVFAGSDVDVLGVKIGSVKSVTPEGTRVKVVIGYDAKRRIPADAFAVILEPTLVADRVVQLAPPYSSGAVLADKAVIPLARTEIPIELDEFNANLTRLAQALGPKGANADGALTRLVQVGAANMRGEGQAANTTVQRMSQLMGTLGDNRDALFGTVRNLQAFATALATHDTQTRAFTTDLDTVSAQLDSERAAFAAAVRNLSLALTTVATFIKDNKKALSTDVASLARVTNILARQKTLLARMIDMGAVGIGNYPHMYTPSARTYNARFNNIATDNPALFVCQLYQSVGGSPQECLSYLKPLKGVPLTSGAGR